MNLILYRISLKVECQSNALRAHFSNGGPFYGPTGSCVRFLIRRYLENPFIKCTSFSK